MSFSAGFARGYGVMADAMDRKRKREQEDELKKISGAKVEKLDVVGKTADGMTQLDENDRPVVTGQKFRLLDQEYDTTPTPQQQNTAKSLAMAGVIKQTDPAKGLELERGIRQQDRAERAQAAEDEYIAKRKEALGATRFSQQQAQYQNMLSEFQAKAEEAKKAKAQGIDVPMPMEPEKPQYGLGAALADRAQLLALDAQYNKLSNEAFTQYADMYKKVQQEGYVDALKLARKGAPLTEVAKAFNASGETKFDPKDVVSDQVVQSPNAPPTRVLKLKDGTVIDVLQELNDLGQADKIYTQFFQKETNRRANNADSRAAASQSNALSDREEEKRREKEARESSVELFMEQNPNASQAQIRAVRAGLMKPATGAEKGSFKFEADKYGDGGIAVQEMPGGAGVVTKIDKSGRVVSRQEIAAPGKAPSITKEEIEATAAQEGMTPEQVVEELKKAKVLPQSYKYN
ncbi:MAG TPA: hypothetical protein VFV57_06020 [Limnobacter sp.]|nr:hypothetical protein [Limnobacter sp.]